MSANNEVSKKIRRKVGDVAIEYMRAHGIGVIGYGSLGDLGEVFSLALKEGLVKAPGSRGGNRTDHPLNRNQAVLNALGHDSRFEKRSYRITNGRAEILARLFVLKPDAHPIYNEETRLANIRQAIRDNSDPSKPFEITEEKLCRGCGKETLDDYRKEVKRPIHLALCKACRIIGLEEMRNPTGGAWK